MIGKKKKILSICVFLILMLWLNQAYCQIDKKKWYFKLRFQNGVEYDNNIEESRDIQQADGLVKIVLNCRAKRYQKSSLLQLTYHGGMQHYFNSPFENKNSHDIQGSFVGRIANHAQLGGKIQGRIKTYNKRNWHYSLTNTELFSLFNLSTFQFKFSYQIEGLNYFYYDQYDFNVQKLCLTFRRAFGHNFSLSFLGSIQTINFERYALYFDPILQETLLSKNKQKDKNNYFLIRASFQKNLLFSFEYLIQDNSSNSYGFSYQHQRITLSLATPISKGILLRTFAGLQRKKYLEQLDRIIITELDSEREKSNFCIIDISKDLFSNLTLIFRYSYYNNESPIPGRYYQKKLTSGSLEYRF